MFCFVECTWWGLGMSWVLLILLFFCVLGRVCVVWFVYRVLFICRR